MLLYHNFDSLPMLHISSKTGKKKVYLVKVEGLFGMTLLQTDSTKVSEESFFDFTSVVKKDHKIKKLELKHLKELYQTDPKTSPLLLYN
jgi:hypothetical protein